MKHWGEKINSIPYLTNILLFSCAISLGVMSAEIKGPSGPVKADIETPMPHRTRICFTPIESGEYMIKLAWNRIPLPHSPLMAYANHGPLPSEENNPSLSSKSRASSISSSSSGGDQKVILTGKGLAKSVCGVEAEFTIDGSRAGPGLYFNHRQFHIFGLILYDLEWLTP